MKEEEARQLLTKYEESAEKQETVAFLMNFPLKLSPEQLLAAKSIFNNDGSILVYKTYEHDFLEGPYSQGEQIYEGYCTVCENRFRIGLDAGKHKESTCCPVCGNKSTIRHRWRFARDKKTLEEGYCLTFSPSEVDPENVVALGFYINKHVDYASLSVDYSYTPVDYFIFHKNADGQHWLRECYDDEGIICGFRRRKSCNFTYEKWTAYKYFFGTDYKSLVKLIPNSFLKYSCLDKLLSIYKGTAVGASSVYTLDTRAIVRFMDLYHKRPQFEMLYKIGAWNILCGYLYKISPTFSTLNWRGNTPNKLMKLKLHKNIWKQLVETKSINKLEFRELAYLQIIAKNDEAFLNKNIDFICEIIGHGNTTYILENFISLYEKTQSYEKILRYIRKQLAESMDPTMRTYSDALVTWRDYFNLCEKLDIALNSKEDLYPKRLRALHDNLNSQLKLKADLELDKRIQKNKKDRKKFNYQHAEIFSRPAVDMQELVDEGKALHHCVGTYAEKYAKGLTNIVFIRKKEAPDTPYYTMEVSNGAVVQVRGDHNKAPKEDVKAFVKAFAMKILKIPEGTIWTA